MSASESPCDGIFRRSHILREGNIKKQDYVPTFVNGIDRIVFLPYFEQRSASNNVD